MKKLISIISLILALVMALSGCGLTADLTIGADNNLTLKESVKLTELEYNDIVDALSDYSEDPSDIFPDLTRVVEGDNVYYTYEKTTPITIDEINESSLDLFYDYEDMGAEDGILESLFSVRKITNSDVLLGCSELSVAASHLKEATAKITITFPEEIVITNGELSNDNKTVTFDGFKRNTNWYAATANSTAPWATAELGEVENVVKTMVDSIIEYGPTIYYFDAYNSKTVYLYWEAIENAETYQVYKRVGSGDWTPCLSTEDNYGLITVTPGIETEFTVTASNDYWATEIDEFASDYITILNPKTTPTIAVAKAKSGRKAAIKPSKIKGADGYLVYMSKKNKSGTFKKVGKIEGETPTAYYKKLSKGKYYFKVKAFKRTLNGTYYSASASKAKSVTIK